VPFDPLDSEEVIATPPSSPCRPVAGAAAAINPIRQMRGAGLRLWHRL
jgi:hypothetical protein